jgi:hypothetical protein
VKEFTWKLSGAGALLRLGKGGPVLDASAETSVSVLTPDKSGLAKVKAADPVVDDDLVTLRHFNSQLNYAEFEQTFYNGLQG